MTKDETLAGAKFYARATAARAVHGVIPQWDAAADEANWLRTRPDVRATCLELVRGIVVACEYERHERTAFDRALGALTAPDSPPP